MAWKKCDWCKRKFNGYGNMNVHEQTVHSQERIRRRAIEDVSRARKGLEHTETLIAELADYRQALTIENLPSHVRVLVEAELSNYFTTHPGLHERTIDERLAFDLESSKGFLVKAQTALDALTAQELARA